MSKAKLTIDNSELEKFKQCVELAGMKVLEVQNLGVLNQVLTYYKNEQQLMMLGRYMEKLPDVIDVPFEKGYTPTRKIVQLKKTKLKTKS